MAAFCLPPLFANKFIKALQDGTIDIEKMALMESGDRRALLAGVVGAENAREVNAMFEKKLLLKNWQRGMISWIKGASGMTKPAQRDMVNRVLNMKDILSPADKKTFLTDYATKKLGVDVTAEESNKIMELAHKAAVERDAVGGAGSEFGRSEKASLAAAALEHYVKSLKPTTVGVEIRSNLTTFLRNLKLANPATPIKTLTGQLENSAVEAIARRIAGRAKSGAAPELISDLSKKAWSYFKNTDFDPTIAEDYESTGKLGEHTNFALPEGMLASNPTLHRIENITRTIAKASNMIVIDYAHVVAFTKFHQMAFFDALHISATNTAMAEGLKGDALKTRTAELVTDAVKIKPDTDMGRMLRADAQQQAARVTSINSTVLSSFAMSAKRTLNTFKLKFPGGKEKTYETGLGDLLMPVAKIPANIIWNGLESATPFGPYLAARDIFGGRRALAALKEKDGSITETNRALAAKALMQEAAGWHRLIRVVGVVGASLIFSSMFNKEDFFYDKYGAGFVKIGGFWVNMEYASLISPAFGGMMQVKAKVNNGDDLLKVVEEYGVGAAQGLRHLPGVDTANQFVTSLATDNDKAAAMYEFAKQQLTAGPISALTSNRIIQRLFFGATGVRTDEDISSDKIDQAQRRVQRAQAAAEYRAE
jgi:hypothetical protein